MHPGYKASSYGRVRGPKDGRIRGPNRERKTNPNNNGYQMITICRRPWLLHRLMLTVFVGPPPEGYQGCHNDGDKTHNHLENLRWDTRQGNYSDSVRHGTAKAPWFAGMHHNVGEKHGLAIVTADLVREIRLSNERAVDIAARLGLSKSHVSRIRGGRIWPHVDPPRYVPQAKPATPKKRRVAQLRATSKRHDVLFGPDSVDPTPPPAPAPEPTTKPEPRHPNEALLGPGWEAFLHRSSAALPEMRKGPRSRRTQPLSRATEAAHNP